jgi:Fe-S cluster biogenesis protein NfuA/Fe-S cluster assembly iron-binding protein IscA
VDLTPRASRQVRSLLADRSAGQPGTEFALRVAPAGAGEPGPEYRISLSPGIRPDDLVLPRNGFRVVVDRSHADTLDGLRIDFLDSGNGTGFVLDRVPRDRPRSLPGTTPAEGGSTRTEAPRGSDRSLWERVQQALDQIRPDLHRDGGDVELVEVEAGAAMIRLTGACSSCSLSAMTLSTVVETTVISRVPEIDRIVPLP